MPSCSLDLRRWRRPVHRVGGEGGHGGFRRGRRRGRRGREHRGRFLGHQVIGLVLVLFVIAEGLVGERVVLMADRAGQHGRGLGRGAARRAGEHGRLGLQQGHGVGGTGRRGARLRAEDALERARAGQAQRRTGEGGRATAFARAHGEGDGGSLRGIHRVNGRRLGQLPPAERTEPGAIDDGGLAVVAIHACLSVPWSRRSHFSPAARGRKLPATWQEWEAAGAFPPGEAARARRAVSRRAAGAGAITKRARAGVTFFVTDGQETTLARAGCRRIDAGGRGRPTSLK